MVYRLLSVLCFACILVSVVACQKSSGKPSSTLNMSIEEDPKTLDPRQVRDLSGTTIIHMLYEGLTRLNEDGDPILALAESVSIEEDQKTYTFKLRKSSWSDGTPVTAYHFENSWKSVLDPKFPAPNAYQLYVIEGAKAAKEGKISLDKVGIKALDDYTLIVSLANPTPYFLNLTATYFYYPVNDTMRLYGSQTDKMQDVQIVTNGPFQLEHWARRNQLTAVKNPYYWDAKSVSLNKISMILVDNPTALSMFERNELDWAGSPLSTIPTDALASLKSKNLLQIKPAAGVYFFRYNVEKPPFNQVNMRQAFTLAINRQDLVQHVLQGNQIPARGFVPPSFLVSPTYFRDHHVSRAKELFAASVDEKYGRIEKIPSITLCYAAGERSHKTAQVVQQQWKDAFGIDVQLQSCESKVFYDRLKNKDYQLAIGSWFADFRDPIAFLDIFKYKDNGTNNTQWENPEYVQFLNLSSETPHNAEREKFLSEAQRVLMEDMPIAPLYYGAYNYLKRPYVKGVYFSELGYLDFKNASIEK